MTAHTDLRVTDWRRVAVSLGYADTETKRAAIRAAADAIDWTDQPWTVARLTEAPLRVLVAAMFYQRRDDIRRAGSARLQLNGAEHALVGVEDAAGTRYFLLDMGHEAAYVLHQAPPAEHTTPGDPR
jgi:hypothetical protein